MKQYTVNTITGTSRFRGELVDEERNFMNFLCEDGSIYQFQKRHIVSIFCWSIEE